MRKLLRSKKGTVIGDLFSGISSTISHFLQSAPKPLLIIIFLLFLLLFATIFSFLLNMTGHFCDTAGNEYKTGSLNFVGNIGLLSQMPSEDELQNDYIEVEGDFFQRNFWYDCSNYYDEDFQYRAEGEEWQNFTNPRYYYIGTDACVTCQEWVRVRPNLEDKGFFYTLTYAPLWHEKICLDERVAATPYEELTFYGKRVCGKQESVCYIPQGYVFDGESNTFLCASDLCMNDNGSISTIGQMWNLKLKGEGARLIPPSPYGDKDYRNALRVECEAGDLDPKLRVFGINPFDYRLWVFIIILSALVWLLFKIKRR